MISTEGLDGKLFVTSGLGGMSGAQAKASVMAGAVGVVAEVNPAALEKRLEQHWVDEAFDQLDAVDPSRSASMRKEGSGLYRFWWQRG